MSRSNAPKLYRIEGNPAAVPADGSASERHQEIMDAFAALRRLIQPATDVSQEIEDAHRGDFQEALKLKIELDEISGSIQRTKQEIATLHYAGAQGREMTRVTDELDAIVEGTELATNTILSAAERVDELAGNLASRLSGDAGEIAREISDHIVQIFEACNFQDITSQRIGKVVNAMQFVEQRVGRMIEIWGGLETFKDVQPIDDPSRAGDRALLNGPALTGDEDSTSQDDIDSLFG